LSALSPATTLGGRERRNVGRIPEFRDHHNFPSTVLRQGCSAGRAVECARHRAGFSRAGPDARPPGGDFGRKLPSPTGKHWRSSNFQRNVLKRAYLAVGWRDTDRRDKWTWHSLRHVFCTVALFTWRPDATDVSRVAWRANHRIALDMCCPGPASAGLPNRQGSGGLNVHR
jgi:hypothetical protein